MGRQIQSLIVLCAMASFVTACGSSANHAKYDSASTLSSFAVNKAATGAASTDGISLSAPQYSMVSVPTTFSLSLPTGVTVSTAQWTLGDGTTQSGPGPITDTYFTATTVNVSVALTDSKGTGMTLGASVTVIPYSEALTCIAQLSASGPSTGTAGQPVNYTINIPSCMTSQVSSVTWNFGDNTTTTQGNSATHTYGNGGSYTITVGVTVSSGTTFTLTYPVTIAPVVTNGCPTAGATQQVNGSTFTQSAACGIANSGMENDTYQTVITQTCEASSNGSLQWVQTSTSNQLVSKGACMGQACALPPNALTGVGAISQSLEEINGVYYLMDGGHLTFYSTINAPGSCGDVASVRTCSNGVLSGSDSYQYLLCTNGCPGVGPSGTTVTGVQIGTVQVSRTCANGSTTTDTYSQITDQTCNNGKVTDSNTRQGGIISAGACAPVITYSWVATGQFSACSAACGGTQSAIYQCQGSDGSIAAATSCSGSAPVVTQACDGNPSAVASSSSSSTTESGAGQCPADQIGTVTQHRVDTTTTTTACVNHMIVTTSSTSDGPWVQDSYSCIDYSGLSCQKEHLDNWQAHGRYDWMEKCKAKLPVVADFLTKYANVKVQVDGQSIGLGNKGRVLYPTFSVQITACDCSDHDDDGDHDGGWFWDDGEWEGSDYGRHLGACTQQDLNDVARHGTCGEHHKQRSCKTVTINHFWHAPVSGWAWCHAPKGAYVSGICVSGHDCDHHHHDGDDDDHDGGDHHDHDDQGGDRW